jgi:hypothetical protein
VKEDEMGRICSTNRSEEECIQHIGGKPQGKKPLVTPSRRWGDNIKMDHREMGWDGLIWLRIGTSEGLL